MKQFFRTLIILLALSYFFSGVGEVTGAGVDDSIKLAVSPIRDEFIAPAGTVVNRQITFYNNSDIPHNIYITTEECVPGNDYGTPICHPARGTGVDITQSSTWITTSDNGIFTVAPNSNKVVTYSMNVPSNAPPGGHYGAVIFNNPDVDLTTGSAVRMNRRINVLYLATVPGNIVVDTTIGDILVDVGPGGGLGSIGPSSLLTLFSAPSEFFDVTMKRLLMVFSDPVESDKLLAHINPLWEKPVLPDDDFLVTLKVPIENAGNTHVMPTGKIYLYDGEDRLKRIGKQTIVDEAGVYLGEKVVDYLPINDEGGNVLPNTDRVYSIDWAGFAFDDIDPTTGEHIIGFESPSAYYSRTAGSDSQFLFPWEKLSLRSMDRSLRAEVEIAYKNPLTGLIENYTLELPVPIRYNYIARTLNWSGIILLMLLVLLLRLGMRRKGKTSFSKKKKSSQTEDEIHMLEQARASMLSKKKVNKTKSVTAKKEVKAASPAAATVKKSITKAAPAKVAPQTASETPVKKVASKKTPTPTAKPAPAPAKKAPVKKPVPKTPPSTEA